MNSVAASNAIGFVLAGGRSSRMGADKALQPLAGQPLVSHALAMLREIGVQASIAGAHAPLSSFADVIADEHPDNGPLGGICAALASTSADLAIFLPVDLPLLPASLLEYMLHHARITSAAVTLASVNGFAQTFPAVIRRDLLPLLQAELDACRRSCFASMKTATQSMGQSVTVLPVELLVQSGHIAHPNALPATRWLLNVNAPEDLRRAHLHLHSSAHTGPIA